MNVVWNGYLIYYFHHTSPKFTLQTFLLVNAKIQLEQKEDDSKFWIRDHREIVSRQIY